MGVGGSLYAGEGDGLESLTIQTGERELDYYTQGRISLRESKLTILEREGDRKRGGERVSLYRKEDRQEDPVRSTESLPVCLFACLSVCL